MYRSDDELRNIMNSKKQKIQIPTNLDNVTVFGDNSEKDRPLKFKLNQKRTKELYEYFLKVNPF